MIYICSKYLLHFYIIFLQDLHLFAKIVSFYNLYLIILHYLLIYLLKILLRLQLFIRNLLINNVLFLIPFLKVLLYQSFWLNHYLIHLPCIQHFYLLFHLYNNRVQLHIKHLRVLIQYLQIKTFIIGMYNILLL